MSIKLNEWNCVLPWDVVIMILKREIVTFFIDNYEEPLQRLWIPFSLVGSSPHLMYNRLKCIALVLKGS